MQYMDCFTVLLLWTSSASVSYKRSLMSNLIHVQIYFLIGLRISPLQYNMAFLFLAWPISAGPTLRRTFCQRCVLRRVLRRLKLDHWNQTKDRSDNNLQKV
jgi:hypothetical protein